MSGRIRVVICIILLHIMTAACSFASTNVTKGSFSTGVWGWDAPAVSILEGSGQVQYIKLKTFHYPSYNADPMNQHIYNQEFSYDPAITSTEDNVDEDNNSYRYSYWGSPSDPYPGTIQETVYKLEYIFDATLENTLDGMTSTTAYPIPPGSIPTPVMRYLQAGTFTQSNEQDIINHATSLAAGCTKEYEAVMCMIDWCKDNLTYFSNPPQHDALWILNDTNHRAQCAGFSHMAIALLRAVGIPARFVGGFSISEQYYIPGPSGGWWYNHGQGTHSWLEVYYLDTGWIPYNAQGQYQYVDTHVYKECIGIDMHDRYPVSCSYAYWVEPPTVVWESEWLSIVSYDDNSLEYRTTYPTPDAQAFADWIEDYPVAVRETDELIDASLRFIHSAPNPFGKRIEIEYQVPKDMPVEVAVYDVLGRRVSLLVKKEKQRFGRCTLRWDGRDDSGYELPSGVYFCRLQGGKWSDVRKIVLVR